MRRAFLSREPQSPRSPDCGQNPGGFSGLEPELLHSRLTANRAALTNLCRCINRSQAALTRPSCLLSSEKRPNKQLRERRALSSLCRLKGRLQKEAVVCISASRICLILFGIFYLCVYLFSARRNPTVDIFKYYSHMILMEHHHHAH